MMETFKNWDSTIAIKYPRTWVLGLHIYLPILILLSIVFYGLGWAYPTAGIPKFRDLSDYADSIMSFSILPMVVISILFVIRQIKFNSLRVHHHLPYKHPYRYFFSYFLVFLFITAIPFAANFGMFHKMSMQIDEVKFVKDLVKINKGYTHFYQTDFSEEVYENRIESVEGEITTVEGTHQIVGTYRIDERMDSLILYRSYIEYSIDGHYVGDTTIEGYGKSGWDTIHMATAIQQIEDFMEVASFYEGQTEVGDMSPSEIVNMHVKHIVINMELEVQDQEPFDVFVDENRFDDVVDCYARVVRKDSHFETTGLQFWLYYISFPLILSLLLFIVCSVKIVDFGWSLLVSAITGMVVMLINGLVAIVGSRGEDTHLYLNLFLITFFVVLFLVTMLGKGVRPSVSRAFAISFQMFYPLLVFAMFGIFDALHDCPFRYDADFSLSRAEFCDGFEYFDRGAYYMFAYAFCTLIAIAGVWVFNKVYTRKYIHPNY